MCSSDLPLAVSTSECSLNHILLLINCEYRPIFFTPFVWCLPQVCPSKLSLLPVIPMIRLDLQKFPVTHHKDKSKTQGYILKHKLDVKKMSKMFLDVKKPRVLRYQISRDNNSFQQLCQTSSAHQTSIWYYCKVSVTIQCFFSPSLSSIIFSSSLSQFFSSVSSSNPSKLYPVPPHQLHDHD